ncbi:nicotinate-nucleotide adenylyltransferase [Acetobacter sp. DsW_063]|uniref:nicotinate-nucleotide adenylyltransferase n=1 Tax=Acetobacter sp. DsW_063 TaxID=1514894 RepID=UPI000A3BE3F9|nr:nicotinate-nucleotide adenylyltransferase [Acetobacter sp. DsW_063]
MGSGDDSAPVPSAFSVDRLPRWGDGRRLRVGLLGGSFNPAHEGHAQIAHRAIRVLGLDQVWLMVSPGNPLKPTRGMAPLAERLASAQALVDSPAIIATALEARLGTRYALDTVRRLRIRFPHVRFVWLMGADVFAELPRWSRWREFVRSVPIAVAPRPHSNVAALRGRTASVLARYRLPSGQVRTLAEKTPPVWAFLPGQQNGISATDLRRSRASV